MTDRQLLTTAESFAIERESKLAVEAAVASVEQPRVRIRDLRQQLRRLAEEEEIATAPRQFAYGYVRLDTDVVFREIDSQGRLHLVAAITGDEIAEIAFWEIDGTLVELSSQADSAGNVDRPTSPKKFGRFIDLARLKEKLGKPGQTFIPELRDETSVDSNFRGTGIAYVYGRFKFKDGVFNGDPPIRIIGRARKPIDPRDGVQRWTINPIVMGYDILVKPKRLGGAGRTADEIDLPSWQSGADFAENLLDAKQFTRTTTVSQFAVNQLLFRNNAVLDFQYGDVVQLSAGGGQTLPVGLSAGTDYHVIPRRHRIGDVGEIGFSSMKLATTFANAMADISLTFTVTTDFQVTKVKEVRYVCAGSYRGRFTRATLERILATAGAKLTKKAGKIAVVTQEFPVTIKTFTESDIEGNITLRNKVGLAERTTSLTGNFVSPARLFQPDDYPKVSDSAFETQDGGAFPQRLELDYVPKASTAQRLARTELNLRRQERRVSFAALMRRYDVEAGDVFTLDYARLGLDGSTPFQCTSRRLFVDIEDSIPRFRMDFNARQLESNTFDPDVSAEELITASRLPTIANPREVKPPSEPQISERLFRTTRGAGARVAVKMAWESAEDPFFRIYQPQYKLSSDTEFIDLPQTTSLSREILDLDPDFYDFRVFTINSLNLSSPAAEKTGVEIKGLSAKPSAITGLSVSITGNLALLQWDLHPDLDVLDGGKIEIRHHCDPAGGQASNSIVLGGGTVNGDATFTQVAALVGTYYVRAFDSLGIPSDFAERSTDDVRPVPFAQIISAGAFQPNDSNQDQVTIAEAPAWLSTNPANTVEIDRSNDTIKLRPKTRISGVTPLFSGITPLVSGVGTLGDVEAEGVYHFFTRLELAQITRFRLEVELDTTIINTEDIFTARPGLVSDFISFSGIIDPSVATAFMEARFTRDDPTMSPVWTPWQRIESRNLFHRAAEFRVRLFSFEPSFNIEVSQAAVRARELDAAA